MIKSLRKILGRSKDRRIHKLSWKSKGRNCIYIINVLYVIDSTDVRSDSPLLIHDYFKILNSFEHFADVRYYSQCKDVLLVL